MYKPTSGERFIYYKGRSSGGPCYFGTGLLGEISESSHPGLIAVEILEYLDFPENIDFKDTNGDYVEDVIYQNHWRKSVREISQDVYDTIVKAAFGSLDLSTHQREFGEILGVDDTDIETSGNSPDDQIDLSHISYDDDTGKPDSQTGGGYASPDKIKLVEEVSVEVVLSLAHEWFPGEAITEMASNNPGYDIRVGLPGQEVAFIEVKGTQSRDAVFNITTNEINFSLENSDRYIFVVVVGIDVDNRTYEDYIRRDGSVDGPEFILTPRQWSGRLIY